MICFNLGLRFITLNLISLQGIDVGGADKILSMFDSSEYFLSTKWHPNMQNFYTLFISLPKRFVRLASTNDFMFK